MDLIINRRHVTLGVKCSARECPAAIALRAAGFPKAEVGCTRVFPHGALFASYNLTLSRKLARAIAKFDKTGKFKVGVYRIPGLKRPNK